MEPPGVSSFPGSPDRRRVGVARRPLSPRPFLGRASVAAVLTIVAACQAPAATSSPAASGGPAATEPPGATMQPTAAATSGPTAGLAGLFHVVGSAPVIPRSMFQDRGAVLPGAITVDAEGGYHAWVVAFGDPPGTQEIHYLTSADAVSWSESADASLAALSEGFGNPGAVPTSVLQTADGWVMYLVGALATEAQGWDIWRATAEGPGGPWTRSDEPILRRGEAGSWDAGALDFPSVLATDPGYSMFYSAVPSNQSTEGSIGMATSTDGVAWTKADGPVAEPGLCGGFDERAIHQPRVVAAPDGLVMVYAGYAGDANSRPAVGFADSRDGGVTWGCEWPANALRVDELPPGDGVHTVNAFLRDGRPSVLVEWLSDGGTDVWLAHLGPRVP